MATHEDIAETKPEVVEDPLETQCAALLQEFRDWWDEEGNALGERNYHEVMQRVSDQLKKLSLPQEEMILYVRYFRFGYNLIYGQFKGRDEYVAIPRIDGILINWQAQKDNCSNDGSDEEKASTSKDYVWAI